MKVSPAIWTLTVCAIIQSSCSPDSASLQVHADQVDELESVMRDLAKETTEQRKRVQAASSDRDRLAIERAQAEMLITKAGEDISALKLEFANYKADYRHAIQARAKGMTLPSLLLDTKLHKNVTVSSVTDTELTILTSEGVTKLPLASMTPDIQELFGYDRSYNIAATSTRKGHDFLESAIEDGKESAVTNKRKIEEARALKKKGPPKYLKAPTTNHVDWRSNSSFEGSYYAPLRKRNP